jgi:glycosyltransferase involved in cell wall biosynthesis
MKISVVIPVYNGAATLDACLRSLEHQTLATGSYEIIVVDDGSTDDAAWIAQTAGVRLVSQHHAGAPAARNAGILAARGEWVAFTNSDCVCARTWLASLLAAAERTSGAIGAAGKTIGYRSQTPAARFVDLMGALDPVRSLAHPRFPFAPTSNVLYRREYLLAVRGFDTRYATYDACDLHTRLLRAFGGAFAYEPRAVVMHNDRSTWREYFRQQFFKGVGYAQFMLAHRGELRWSLLREIRASLEVIAKAFGALVPGTSDAVLLRRGSFIRSAAQHAGFLRTYYNRTERRRW